MPVWYQRKYQKVKLKKKGNVNDIDPSQQKQLDTMFVREGETGLQ